MDRWEKSLRGERFRLDRKNPSFSSTLLDSIYRSIDDGDGRREEELILYRETMRKKQSSSGRGNSGLREEEITSHRRASLIEKWMEKKVSEKVVVRRKSAPDFGRELRNDRNLMFPNSTSSSSDSSCGGGFSSSEAESLYGAASRSSGFTPQRPKPVRTSVPVRSEKPLQQQQQRKFHDFDTHRQERNSIPQNLPKHEDGFVKTKSRASKIYDDLKKVKQPISPGSRLASFLNSLFAPGNAKKAKMSSSAGVPDDSCSERKSKSTQASTCSSASSFSRSCLSKTPSSRGKLSNGTKRSVRFYPVSVIVDEDCRPCGHKCLYEDEPGLTAVKTARKHGDSPALLQEELQFHLKEKNRRVEEAARNLLKGYQKKFDMRDLHNDEDDEDDDDAASYSSSDLFELDNLAATGFDRYREELPVYETTHFDTNRAIANGFIL